MVKEINHAKTIIGDDVLITFMFICKIDPPEIVSKRCWKGYTKENLCNELTKVNFTIDPEVLILYSSSTTS